MNVSIHAGDSPSTSSETSYASDCPSKKYLGENAVRDFYGLYRQNVHAASKKYAAASASVSNLHVTQQRGTEERFMDEDCVDDDGTLRSPRLQYIDHFFDPSSTLQQCPPQMLGIVRRRDDSAVELNHYGIGSRFVDPVSHTVSLLPEIKVVNLRENRLKDKDIANFVKKMGKFVEDIDLSYNVVGMETIKVITSHLSLDTSNLKSICMENACLSSKTLQYLCNALHNCACLTSLDLSYNAFDSQACLAYSQLVRLSRSLKYIVLKWCNIIGNKEGSNKEGSKTKINQIEAKRESGAEAILSALGDNVTIEMVDLSWNNLGTNAQPKSQSGKCVDALGKMFSNNKTILYLNLSHCHFTVNDVETLSYALNNNHTICGLHFDGNIASIDSKGFLHVLPEEDVIKETISKIETG
jgi:hypothetical protein